MADSPTPKPKSVKSTPVKPTFASTNPAQLALASFAGLTVPLAVAYSGGADSTALL
ncbi:MAG: hypothetical protein ACJAR7_000760, partial [Polaromonas sp.]